MASFSDTAFSTSAFSETAFSFVVAVTSSSGIHRLANANLNEKRNPNADYQSIDWNSPVFGSPVIGETEENIAKPESLKLTLPKKPLDLTKEQNDLSDIDKEIQNLLRDIISQEGTIAELEAIEQSIQETGRRLLEAEQLKAERLRKRKLALLILLSAA